MKISMIFATLASLFFVGCGDDEGADSSAEDTAAAESEEEQT